MRIPNEQIGQKKQELEVKGFKVLGWEFGLGRQCPHCNSFDLEHNNNYPRLKDEKAIVFMTRCKTCGLFFDEPRILEDYWVVFRTEKGIHAFNLGKSGKD